MQYTNISTMAAERLFTFLNRVTRTINYQNLHSRFGTERHPYTKSRSFFGLG